MPAKVKKEHLTKLSHLGKLANLGPFYGYMNEVLKGHGCNIATHFVNSQGWIIKRELA